MTENEFKKEQWMIDFDKEHEKEQKKLRKQTPQSKELRKKFPESTFMYPVVDGCIIGVNPINDSIIYDYGKLVECEMELRKDEFDGDFESEMKSSQPSNEFIDFLNQCDVAVYNTFEDYQNNPEDGKVSPTLFDNIR